MKGYVRGFDARTGKRLWIFHTIPRREFGNTWRRILVLYREYGFLGSGIGG